MILSMFQVYIWAYIFEI